MLTRRLLLSALPLAATIKAQAATDSFAGFLAGLRADARRVGISAITLDRALAGLAPNAKVLERDRHQPEFTMTWAQYRALLITDKRIDAGRAAVRDNRALLSAVQARFGVGPAVVTGIWGLESSFGTQTGDFHVVDALATLAWDGRRASFFRPELIAALKILDHGDVTPTRMTGSYAGAMGQPQFMPTSFLRYAVDFEGNGKRDIWTSRADVPGIDCQLPGEVRLAARGNLGPGGDAARRLRHHGNRARGAPAAGGLGTARRAAGGGTLVGHRGNQRRDPVARRRRGRRLRRLSEFRGHPALQSLRFLCPGGRVAGGRTGSLAPSSLTAPHVTGYAAS